MTERRVLLVYPRFLPNSFWVYTPVCEALGRRCPAPPLGLITMAALLPRAWALRMVDCNAEDLRDEDLAWADLVMTGGMLVQQRSTFEIIRRCRSRSLPVAVGGPDVTTSPQLYAEADFRLLGEVEPIMADFAAAFDRGVRGGDWEAERFKTDVTTSPVPRFDLLNMDHYLRMAVQFSRGCPFTCEFCDIIELFGRVPRVKSTEQILAELDALMACGWRGHVDFVDDNFIGNKKALKLFLPQLASWLEERGHPFEFSTQASLNLADDIELLAMMREANFFLVFIGIESADSDTLRATRKKQNSRRDIAADVQRIYGFGMFVIAGFIVGFDAERSAIAAATSELIEKAAIPVCMIGLLYALPHTQLARRLLAEDRLDGDYVKSDSEADGDHCSEGLNFTTLRPREAILTDCRDLIDAAYAPELYFGRLRRVARMLDCTGHRNSTPLLLDIYELSRFAWHCLLRPSDMRRHAWGVIVDCLRHNPAALRIVFKMTILYLHLGPFSRYVKSGLNERIVIERDECASTGGKVSLAHETVM